MVDTANSVNDVVYRLGFLSLADLVANAVWLTRAELYQWADDAAKRLSYESGLFLAWTRVSPWWRGRRCIPCPTATSSRWRFGGPEPLRITRVEDLWALDGSWGATSGDPKRCSMDAGSVGTITLYPKPAQGGTLGQICQEYPATISQGSSQVGVPSVLQDYFSYALLAGVWGKESPAAMGEMAEHYRKRMELYEQVIEHLWGPGQ